jgi:hypothetical protein
MKGVPNTPWRASKDSDLVTQPKVSLSASAKTRKTISRAALYNLTRVKLTATTITASISLAVINNPINQEPGFKIVLAQTLNRTATTISMAAATLE